MQQQIAQLKEDVKEHFGASEVMKHLMDKGEIEFDEEGNVSAAKHIHM
jgi:hypothetical protein